MLKATGDLDKTLSGVLPTKGLIKKALDKSINSLKGYAKTQQRKIDQQRKSRAKAQSQRAEVEAEEKDTDEEEAVCKDNAVQQSIMPAPLEVEYPDTTRNNSDPPSMATHDDVSPSQNTRAAK